MPLRSAVLTATLMALLTGCSATGSTPVQGVITVPALWVGADSTGVEAAGIEPAAIRASTVGPPGFTVDLETVQAQGAGPQWQAATAVAATVAALFSGRDPRSIDLQYSVTGPIDGPSAGAILTVGSLAAVRGESLDPRVTMTGTVAPDGTIGRVGGLAAKVRAAAQAGFTTMLIPLASEKETGPDGSITDVIDLGRGLGLVVRPVADVTEAYELFAGMPLAPAPGASTELAPSVQRATSQGTRTLIERLRDRLVEAGSDLPLPERKRLESDAAAALVALNVGDTPGPYGTAVLASRVLERISSSAQARRQIARAGSAQARASIADAAQKDAARARALLVEGANVAGLGVEQVASLPFALAPIAYARAALMAIPTGLAESGDDASIVAAAAELGDQRFVLDVVGPDGLGVARASSARPASFSEAPGFLSGYTDFLVRGGDATLAYLGSVSGTRPFSQPGNAAQAAAVLQELAHAAPPAVSGLSDEIEQLAYSVAYFLASEDLVSRQSLGLPPPGIEWDGEVRDDEAVRAAVASGSRVVGTYGSSLVEAGSGVDAALWGSAWGAAMPDSESARAHRAMAWLGALHEQWSAVLGCLLIQTARALDGDHRPR